MTLVEFLAPLKKATNRDRCLSVLYYLEVVEHAPLQTVEGVREGLKRARVANSKQVNLPDVLAKAGHLVDSPGTSPEGRRLWTLTDSGHEYVTKLLGIEVDESEVVHDVSTLRAIEAKIADDVVRGYVEEALLCLSVDALRAAVVFLWTGAIRTLQERALQAGQQSLNAAIAKHDQKARRVTKVEDFSGVKDVVALQAFRDLGLIDKGEWGTLQEGLDLRNRCGHPTKYRPGVKRVSAFVEDVCGIVFQ